MNVFVLCTGRTGSVTFAGACTHITNFTSAHESRMNCVGDDRLAYPPNHIEADNRLSWFLGRLDQAYGDRAFYVHLLRDPDDVARSFVRRYRSGIMRAYTDAILGSPEHAPIAVARDYCQTVNTNIELFLRDKSRSMRFEIEKADQHFPDFWQRIGAEGDLDAALAEFTVRHNASGAVVSQPTRPILARIFTKALRLVRELPTYIKYT